MIDAQPATTTRRAAGLALAAAAAVFLLAEFVAAAAWTGEHPYSYTYHYISDLGVRGPLVALDQYMYSPLDWVFNSGFFLFGVLVIAGIALLRGLHGWRRAAVLLLGVIVGVGSMVLAFFPGDGEADRLGRFDFHGLGAMMAIVGGNILIIVLGRMCGRLGADRRTGRAMVVLGAFGLVSLVAFVTVAGSGANVLIGLVERCAVYPVFAGLIGAGVAIWRRPVG
ncbi:DUF998 domain-containing protein [Catenuloplanes japonicus]|uniref:DUF998 domain-containing protein n=1 Tax=Catenuloplanes japonicus TaxID=33876 RepID=UPI000525F6AC|nr:DUF998 domain-containing protein [Catenuloplanes japonicus]